jgi:hypothetical protein
MAQRHTARRVPLGWVVFGVAALVLGWLALEDVGFRDSGELGTAGFGLGVAHPTGFAIDVLLLRFWSLLPLGHVAWRQNLGVALEAAAALGLLAELCDRLAQRLGVHGRTERAIGGLIAATGLGTWLTFLETATAVEVYSLALLGVLIAACAVERGGRAIGICYLLIGLSPGLHITAGSYALLLALAALVYAAERDPLRAFRVRALLIAFGALIIAYLPLASLRDPALDWGDPQTVGGLFAHLTAARIRSSFHGEMLSSDPESSLTIIGQLFELWPLLPLALLAVAIGWMRKPLVVLGPLVVLSADVAYAAWLNPMGAADRQVGHTAGACVCLLAGLGAGWLASWLSARGAASRALGIALGMAFAVCLVLRVGRAELADGYAASELVGSGGPLASVPARALVLCSTDDACAAGMFALVVDGVRPDVDIAPAQHLWDRTVLRRIEGVAALRPWQRAEPPPAQRAQLAGLLLRGLVSGSQPRPVLLDSADPLRRAGLGVQTASSESVPFLLVPLGGTAHVDAADRLARLQRLRAARLDARAPQSERGQHAWSEAYSTLGVQALGSATAVVALRAAVELAPARAVAWTNLGVALEATGDLPQAVACAHRAIELAPQRPTPWVNLARMQTVLGQNGEARSVLELAKRAGVRDPRLDQLAQQLARPAQH